MAEAVVEQQVAGEQRIKMTYEEYQALPEMGVLTEWVDGEAIIFMSPLPIHQIVITFLVKLLSFYVDVRRLGTVLVAPVEMRVVPDGSAREPDVFFIASENLSRLGDKRLDGPADLVIEVISEDSVSRDRTDKFYEYQDGGVREYWLIDPRPSKQRIDLYWLTAQGRYQAIVPNEDGRYYSTVIPGLWFNLEWILREQLPDAFVAAAQMLPQSERATAARTLGLL